MIEIPSKNYEIYKEFKGNYNIDTSLFRKKTNAKTFTGFLIGKMKVAYEERNTELVFIIQEIYKKYKEFEEKEKAQIRLAKWKGKSSLELIFHPQSIEIITFQKPDQDSSPQEVRHQISHKEINLVIDSINKLSSHYEKIPTKAIGELIYEKSWNEIFSDRSTHITLNLILRVLDKLNMIKYRGGFSIILQKIENIDNFVKGKEIKNE
ncbi:MAG: hypothetical protein QW727_03930 [Candidatus Pacearchaeota archaeon]